VAGRLEPRHLRQGRGQQGALQGGGERGDLRPVLLGPFPRGVCDLEQFPFYAQHAHRRQPQFQFVHHQYGQIGERGGFLGCDPIPRGRVSMTSTVPSRWPSLVVSGAAA